MEKEIRLKESHEYYLQVQMAVGQRTWCDFVSCSPIKALTIGNSDDLSLFYDKDFPVR